MYVKTKICQCKKLATPIFCITSYTCRNTTEIWNWIELSKKVLVNGVKRLAWVGDSIVLWRRIGKKVDAAWTTPITYVPLAGSIFLLRCVRVICKKRRNTQQYCLHCKLHCFKQNAFHTTRIILISICIPRLRQETVPTNF